DTNKSDLVTPRIDQAVEMYRHRQQQRSNPQPSSTDSSVIQSVTDTEQSPGPSRHRSFVKGKTKFVENDQDKRLEQLEEQIAQLLNKAKSDMVVKSSSEDFPESSSTADCPRVTRLEAERDKTMSGDSDCGHAADDRKTKMKRSRLPSYRKSTASSRARKDAQAK
ncbi:uncharacterized protein LOC132745616, partial [Ruditapes philippinarum]|uniref:uncharacterized protein LOC132745616 n=1 Tax=Ruditapes philippinarum TaxID=129788 RepID=UPI00295BD2E4